MRNVYVNELGHTSESGRDWCGNKFYLNKDNRIEKKNYVK